MTSVGILGGGFMAAVHAQAARAAGGSLRGIVTSNPRSASRAAARLGVEKAYTSVEEMLLDERIDVIHVCTPNALHAESTLLAVAAGKHVICEKPLTLSIAEAIDITRAADDAGIVGTVPFVYRFHPMVREARERVTRGDLGAPLTIRGSYLQDWMLESGDEDWRVDPSRGGRSRAFADIGSHLVDLIEFVAHDRLSRLVAITRTFFTRGTYAKTEDAVSLTGQMESGALINLLVSQVAAGHKNDLVIEMDCAKSSVAFAAEVPETLWIGGRESARRISRDPAVLHGDARRLSRLPAGHPQGYQDAFDSFVADTYTAIRTGMRPAGLPTFQDGLRAVMLTDTVLRSSQKSEWVDVPDIPIGSRIVDPAGHMKKPASSV